LNMSWHRLIYGGIDKISTHITIIEHILYKQGGGENNIEFNFYSKICDNVSLWRIAYVC
jgi:hypothetical protein